MKSEMIISCGGSVYTQKSVEQLIDDPDYGVARPWDPSCRPAGKRSYGITVHTPFSVHTKPYFLIFGVLIYYGLDKEIAKMNFTMILGSTRCPFSFHVQNLINFSVIKFETVMTCYIYQVNKQW